MRDQHDASAVLGAGGPPTRLGVALLVLVTAGWGSTFLLVKDVVGEMPVMHFLTLRFALAALALVALRPRTLTALTKESMARGVALGLCLAGGYVFQTLGLQHTSAAISGFITGLSVVFTPLFAWPLLGQRGSRATLLAVLVATGGLAVMSLRGVSVGLGELLTLLCAILYALQIVGLGAWSSAKDAYRLTVIQLLTVAVVCGLTTLPGGPGLPPTRLAWFGVLATALLATAVAFVVQSWAQSFISATRAAIVFTLEPAFAGLVAYLGGEHLGWPVLLGGALVLLAMLLAELGPHGSSQPEGPRRGESSRGRPTIWS
jgi:drug/metabolite transporter (DMT)-like permease